MANINSVIKEKFEPVIREKLIAMGLELYELKYIMAGSRAILRVFIDKESPVTISDCETVSHELSILLDVENFSQMPYILEVSSPGIDRPLVTIKDFKRAAGNNIKLRIRKPEGGFDTIYGILLSCSEECLEIKTATATKMVPLADIDSGKIETKF